mgnify:CR=1 FL=1
MWNIYVVRMASTDYYKIGRTQSDVKKRIVAMQCSNPYELTVSAQITIKDKSFEKYMHNRYKEHAIRGEWFLFKEDVIDEVLDLKKNKTRFSYQTRTPKKRKESLKVIHRIKPMNVIFDEMEKIMERKKELMKIEDTMHTANLFYKWKSKLCNEEKIARAVEFQNIEKGLHQGKLIKEARDVIFHGKFYQSYLF